MKELATAAAACDTFAMAFPSRKSGRPALAPGVRIMLVHDQHGDLVEVEVPDPSTVKRRGPMRAESTQSTQLDITTRSAP
jgi:hypothetical protein